MRRRSGSFPSLAFLDIPLKATPSPASTSSSETSLSSSSSPVTPISEWSYASLSHPDWPKSDTLFSPPSSRLSTATKTSSVIGSQASCYISDEDLLDLAQLPLYNDIRIPEHFAIYGYRSATGNTEETKSRDLPPVGLVQSLPASRKGVPSGGKKRRRSSPLKRRKMVLGMSPIPELSE
ncbi:MAG: hypothetical protein Q9164_001298 [Protoblastenia rupestris]